MLRVISSLLLILFISCPIALSQENSNRLEVKTSLKFNEETPIVGSLGTYSVTIEWMGPEDQLKFIPPVLEIEGMKIENTGVSTESKQSEQGWLIQYRTFSFDLIPEKKGKVIIESFPIQYMDKTGGALNQIEIPGKIIHVRGKPLNIPWKIVLPSAGALLVLFLFFVLRVRKKKRQEEDAQSKEIDPAVETLNRIERLNHLLEEANFKEYINCISKFFDAYISDQNKEHYTKGDNDLLLDINQDVEHLKYSQNNLTHIEVTGLKRKIERFLEIKRINILE